MRMLETGGQLDLTLESLRADSQRHVRREDFHYQVAVERAFVSDEHARHPAARQLAVYAIAVAEGVLKLFFELGNSP
jgi:hypothetical protein